MLSRIHGIPYGRGNPDAPPPMNVQLVRIRKGFRYAARKWRRLGIRIQPTTRPLSLYRYGTLDSGIWQFWSQAPLQTYANNGPLQVIDIPVSTRILTIPIQKAKILCICLIIGMGIDQHYQPWNHSGEYDDELFPLSYFSVGGTKSYARGQNALSVLLSFIGQFSPEVLNRFDVVHLVYGPYEPDEFILLSP